MLTCIIRIAAAVTGALLLAGCSSTLDPARSEAPIGFSAGSALLRDDAPPTKFGQAIEGTSFQSGSSFLLYGRRNTDPLLFSAREVSLSGSLWEYENPEQWNWTSDSDYYDFLALYLGDLHDAGRLTNPLPSCNTDNPLSVSVAYDPSQEQYDLMLAGKRRTYDAPEGRTATVHLTFLHMLSAVKLRIANVSDASSLTFTGYHFENLVSRGTASVTATYDGEGNASYAWTGLTRLATAVGGTANLSTEALNALGTAGFLPHALSPGENQGNHSYLDLMIPQRLDEKIGIDGWPALVLEYTPTGESATSARILLKDIYTDPAPGQEPAAISKWEMGKQYLYEIELSLDGGVQVHVTTSDWDSVPAETPGLLLPEL
ncbi:MAG: fimbrillin family protein [Bacteroidales bacterium]|jgi:hypothetical protein|nr:fimbrillin family protein [Bacteroidales bacterium]